MKNILPFHEFSKIYDQQRAIEYPKRVKSQGVSLWIIGMLIFGLLAVNILSGAHTISVIAKTVDIADTTVKNFVGISGFFAIEFIMFTFMLVPTNSWLRYVVIILSLIAAIASNVYSTQLALATQETPPPQLIAVVLGVFAPLANVSAGEVFRHLFNENRRAVRAVEAQFQEQLEKWGQKKRGAYTVYLKSQGVKDSTVALLLSSGNIDNNATITLSDNTVTDDNVTITHDNTITLDDNRAITGDSVTVTKPITKKRDNDNRIALLAQRIADDNTITLSYRELQKRYSASPNTIKKAIALLNAEDSGG